MGRALRERVRSGAELLLLIQLHMEAVKLCISASWHREELKSPCDQAFQSLPLALVCKLSGLLSASLSQHLISLFSLSFFGSLFSPCTIKSKAPLPFELGGCE